MPTGYTRAVADGTITTLADFAHRCAHAFVSALRETPPETKVPKAVNVDAVARYEVKLKALKSERAKLRKMGAAAVRAAHAAAAKADAKRVAAANAESAAVRARYESMRTAVLAWRPDANIAGLRAFMLDQLGTSMSGDCVHLRPSVHDNPDTWHKDALYRLNRDVEYYADQLAKSRSAAAAGQTWLDAFHASLPPKNAA